MPAVLLSAATTPFKSIPVTMTALGVSEEALRFVVKYDVQPVAMVVGRFPRLEYLVVYKDVKYVCETALKAIDIVFKLFILLDVGFPPDSPLCWAFLREHVYKLDMLGISRESPHVKTLANDLKL